MRVLVFAATLTSAPVSAQSLAPELERGLVALLTQQCEAVIGWAWDQAGPPEPAPNVGGVVANALLDAYERRGNGATWISLTQYAHHLAEAHADPGRLPYKADIEFLARWGARAGDPAATELARELFVRLERTSPTGAQEYRRIAGGRADVPEIIGYDVALAIRAALAVDEVGYARDLAAAAVSAGAARLRDPSDSFDVVAAGALASALGRLESPELVAARERLTGTLVAAQNHNGAWALNNTQATAYAVLALGRSADGPARDAATRGRRWLLQRQLEAGTWAAFHDGLPEPFVGPVLPLVEAETLSALVAGI